MISIAMGLPAHVLAQTATPQPDVGRPIVLPAPLVAQTATPQTTAPGTSPTATTATPQTSAEPTETLEQVTVTGSRVITNGFEAPTLSEHVTPTNGSKPGGDLACKVLLYTSLAIASTYEMNGNAEASIAFAGRNTITPPEAFVANFQRYGCL
jgi:hypothetical protein